MAEGDEPATSSGPAPAASTQPEPSASTSTDNVGPVPTNQEAPAASSSVGVQDRGELVARARAFLNSPAIQGQDVFARRRFLAEKGLTEAEINGLLSESVAVRAPPIPPRNYPQAPPSNLPTLLLGLARLFSWIGIGSAALVFLYYRVLLPRIIKTAQARKAIRTHHLSLMTKLNESIASLKEAQKDDFASLPRADPYKEDRKFAKCKTLSELLVTLSEKDPDYATLPPIPLLRCAIGDLLKRKGKDEPNPTAEDILRLLEGRIPWLASEEGYTLKRKLYDTLLSCPLFVEEKPESSAESSETPALSTWTYVAPTPPVPSPLVTSLDSLSSALPRADKTRVSPFGHAIEALSEFTGYISSQMYSPYQPPPGGGMSSGMGPAEEQLKREIRTLKGLVLNRKSFMPTIPRPGLVPRPTS